MRGAKRIGLAVLSVATAAALSTFVGAQPTPKVKIRGVIATPQVTAPVNLTITILPAVQDNDGNYLAPKSDVQVRYSQFDPKSMTRPQDFEMELEILKEYEIRVDMVDDNGDPVRDRTYYFADVNDAHPEGRTPLRLDTMVPIPLAFRWEPRSLNKGNFISPVPGGNGFVLTHYINPATVPGS
ncbi:MAG: hypothetical protein LAO51_06900 [Acidobacteriia bacterium]|nr:hypothetical protein [Terriglobia bacterium]